MDFDRSVDRLLEFRNFRSFILEDYCTEMNSPCMEGLQIFRGQEVMDIGEGNLTSITHLYLKRDRNQLKFIVRYCTSSFILSRGVELAEAAGIGGIGGFVVVVVSSPKHIVVAPPGEARTLVEGLDKLMSVLMRVLIV